MWGDLRGDGRACGEAPRSAHVGAIVQGNAGTGLLRGTPDSPAELPKGGTHVTKRRSLQIVIDGIL